MSPRKARPSWLLPFCLLAAACSARPGMFCQTDSDCRTGLVCAHPPADAAPGDGGPFGICEQARHGLGEVCLWSSECQAPLFCSNQLGEFTGDGRHGRCKAPPQLGTVDLGVPDLTSDAPSPPDGGTGGG